MNKEETKTAVNSLVTPHLDYGNALLYDKNGKYLRKLQVAQNLAARLIKRLRKHDRITHIRKELHWLPISFRTELKLLNMTWNALNEAPFYISNLLRKQPQQTINLRSNGNNLLLQPKSTNKFGARFLMHCSLPLELIT